MGNFKLIVPSLDFIHRAYYSVLVLVWCLPNIHCLHPLHCNECYSHTSCLILEEHKSLLMALITHAQSWDPSCLNSTLALKSMYGVSCPPACFLLVTESLLSSIWKGLLPVSFPFSNTIAPLPSTTHYHSFHWSLLLILPSFPQCYSLGSARKNPPLLLLSYVFQMTALPFSAELPGIHG